MRRAGASERRVSVRGRHGVDGGRLGGSQRVIEVVGVGVGLVAVEKVCDG